MPMYRLTGAEFKDDFSSAAKVVEVKASVLHYDAMMDFVVDRYPGFFPDTVEVIYDSARSA
jgi:hypothetical protein